MLTTKQTTTLILFAQNYSLQVIAKKQKVSLSTIRERIKSLSENHPKEFSNALALRETYKRNKHAIKNTAVFSNFDTPPSILLDWFEDTNRIKQEF